MMELKIKNVIDYGTHGSERVELTVVSNCNLKYYMIADTTYNGQNSISNKMRHVFWFTPQDVKSGDELVVYTKNGINSSEYINGGRNVKYIFYWGLSSYVWNNSGDAAILFKLNNWNTTRVVLDI